MSRMDAIKGEDKQREQGGYGVPRKWYVNQKKLEELGLKQFKAPEGDNFLSIIPPPNPEKYFGLKIFVHYNIGPNGDAYLCKKMMLNKPCPLCARREQLKAAEAEESLIKALSCFPPRYLFWVLNMKSAETMKDGPQLYDAPQTINDEILGLSKNKRTHEMLDISDPDNGKVLVFERKGLKAMNTEYKAFSLEDREPLSDDDLAVPDLEELLHYGTDEEMLASLGTSVRKEPDGEADPPAMPSRSTRPVRTSATAAPAEATDPAPTSTPAAAVPERRRTAPVREEPAAAPVEETPAPAVSRRARPAPVQEASQPVQQGEGPTPPAAAPAEGDDAIRSRLRDRLARRRASTEGQ